MSSEIASPFIANAPVMRDLLDRLNRIALLCNRSHRGREWDGQRSLCALDPRQRYSFE